MPAFHVKIFSISSKSCQAPSIRALGSVKWELHYCWEPRGESTFLPLPAVRAPHPERAHRTVQKKRQNLVFCITEIAPFLWAVALQIQSASLKVSEVLASVYFGWPLLEQSPGRGGRCTLIVIRLFPLALGLECRAGPGNGLRKINILILFLTGTRKDKSCLRSSRGYIWRTCISAGKAVKYWPCLWKGLSLSLLFLGRCGRAAVLHTNNWCHRSDTLFLSSTD